jgi:hypothetical protein
MLSNWWGIGDQTYFIIKDDPNYKDDKIHHCELFVVSLIALINFALTLNKVNAVAVLNIIENINLLPILSISIFSFHAFSSKSGHSR